MRTQIKCPSKSRSGSMTIWTVKISPWTSWLQISHENHQSKLHHGKNSNVPNVQTPKCYRPISIIWWNVRLALIDLLKFTGWCHWKPWNSAPIPFFIRTISRKNWSGSMMWAACKRVKWQTTRLQIKIHSSICVQFRLAFKRNFVLFVEKFSCFCRLSLSRRKSD